MCVLVSECLSIIVIDLFNLLEIMKLSLPNYFIKFTELVRLMHDLNLKNYILIKKNASSK